MAGCRPVHIEVAHQLNTDSFIHALGGMTIIIRTVISSVQKMN